MSQQEAAPRYDIAPTSAKKLPSRSLKRGNWNVNGSRRTKCNLKPFRNGGSGCQYFFAEIDNHSSPNDSARVDLLSATSSTLFAM